MLMVIRRVLCHFKIRSAYNMNGGYYALRRTYQTTGKEEM
jgi:hypothetical protein